MVEGVCDDFFLSVAPRPRWCCPLRRRHRLLIHRVNLVMVRYLRSEGFRAWLVSSTRWLWSRAMWLLSRWPSPVVPSSGSSQLRRAVWCRRAAGQTGMSEWSRPMLCRC